MDVHEYETGLSKDQIETPALMVDLSVVYKNIHTMADYCKSAGINLRPHAKIHKATPFFSWAQIRAGAIGITVSKLSEAEVLASAGVRDILIANQVVGTRRIRRLVNLSLHSDIVVAVDCEQNVRQISQAAWERGAEVGIVVEVNIGNDRCGVEPMDETLTLARLVSDLSGLRFRGLMGYDGHLVFVSDQAQKHHRSTECYQLLAKTRRYLETNGIPVEIVSGGGTATYQAAATVPGITELQAGSYIFNDSTYYANGIVEFDQALSVLATVISRPKRGGASGSVAILDLGRKAISLTYGLPEVREPSNSTIFSMPQEHSRLRLDKDPDGTEIGDTVEVWVGDANGTINLYDKIYAIRDEIVEAVFDISGRGKVT